MSSDSAAASEAVVAAEPPAAPVVAAKPAASASTLPLEGSGEAGRKAHVEREDALSQLIRGFKDADALSESATEREKALAEGVRSLSIKDKLDAVERHLASIGSAGSSSSIPYPIFTALKAVLVRIKVESESEGPEKHLEALQAEKESIEALSTDDLKSKFKKIHTAMGIRVETTETLDKEIKRVQEGLISMSATATAAARAEAGASAKELDAASAKPKSKKVSDKLIAGIKSIGEIAAKPTLSAWGLTKRKTQQMASLTKGERDKLIKAAQQVREAWESPVLTPAEIKRVLVNPTYKIFTVKESVDSRQFYGTKYSLADLQTAIISKLTSGMKEFRAGMVDEFDKLARAERANAESVAKGLVTAYSAKLEQKFGIKLSATDQNTIAGVVASDGNFTKAIKASQNPDATKKSINDKALFATLGTLAAAGLAVGIIGVTLNFGLGVVGVVGLAMLTYYGAKKFMEWKRKRDVGKQITTKLELKMQELFSVDALKGKVAVKDGFLDALVEVAKKAFNVSKASAVVAGRAATTAGAAVGTGAVAVGGGTLTAAAVAGTAAPVVGAAAALASGGGVAAGVAGVAVGLVAARFAVAPITLAAKKLKEMGVEGVASSAGKAAVATGSAISAAARAVGTSVRKAGSALVKEATSEIRSFASAKTKKGEKSVGRA